MVHDLMGLSYGKASATPRICVDSVRPWSVSVLSVFRRFYSGGGVGVFFCFFRTGKSGSLSFGIACRGYSVLTSDLFRPWCKGSDTRFLCLRLQLVISFTICCDFCREMYDMKT